jgi:Fic family protein
MAWTDELTNSPIGELVIGREGYTTYLPARLPETVDFSIPLVNALDRASRAVSLLAGVGETLPNPDLLIRPFLTREAILSSRIEGTIASASDVFKLEASDERGQSPSDAREVLNYVHALRMGVDMLNDVPISTRLVRALHERPE